MNTYVYFLLDSGTIVYVGHTAILQNRIKNHEKNKTRFERLLIAYFRPKYNIRVDWKNFEIKDFKYKEPELV